MLTKLMTLVKGKVAAAVLGVVLVGGGGGAVAVAAAQGHLNGLGLQSASSDSNQKNSTDSSGANSKDGSHAEGMLTACDATGNTIGVTDAKGTVYTFAVTTSTKFNGDIHGNDKGGSTSASNPAFGLTDLCALLNKVKVQVQATASTSGSTTTYSADKITVEGQGTGEGSTSEGNGKAESTETPDAQHQFVGTVGNLNGTSFTLTFKNGVQYTVDASKVKLENGVTLASLVGKTVMVEGSLSGTTVTAWSVETQSSGDNSGSDGGSTGSSTDH